MAVFWDVTPCSLVDIERCFSETSVSIYQATQRNIPEDNHVHTRRRENLKSQLYVKFIKRKSTVVSMRVFILNWYH
jgi:hypothetical protein